MKIELGLDKHEQMKNIPKRHPDTFNEDLLDAYSSQAGGGRVFKTLLMMIPFVSLLKLIVGQ